MEFGEGVGEGPDEAAAADEVVTSGGKCLEQQQQQQQHRPLETEVGEEEAETPVISKEELTLEVTRIYKLIKV